LAVLLSVGSDPELLLLRSQVLEKSGHSVVTVSNLLYSVPVFQSVSFDGVIFCHLIPADVRGKLVRQMLGSVHHGVPIFVFRKPLAPGDDGALTVIASKTPAAAALCKELMRSFRLSGDATRHSLQSWKEIATFVGRGVRTVQRWEEFGLPVHRPSGSSRGRVLVLVAELEQWMKSREGQPCDKDQTSNQADAPAYAGGAGASD
jgi:hypothetical protein